MKKIIKAQSNGAISDVNPDDVMEVIEKIVKIVKDILK